MKASENATIHEDIKFEPFMNVFDFWWLYNYFSDGDYSGFVAALTLLFVVIYTAGKLWKAVRNNGGKTEQCV